MSKKDGDPANTVKPLSPSMTEGVVVSEESSDIDNDLTRRARVSESLQEGRDFVLATAMTRDHFATLSLGEQLRRRVSLIGNREGYSGVLGLERTSDRRVRSLQDELLALKERVLDSLEQAKNIIDEK